MGDPILQAILSGGTQDIKWPRDENTQKKIYNLFTQNAQKMK